MELYKCRRVLWGHRLVITHNHICNQVHARHKFCMSRLFMLNLSATMPIHVFAVHHLLACTFISGSTNCVVTAAAGSVGSKFASARCCRLTTLARLGTDIKSLYLTYSCSTSIDIF